MTGKKDGRKGRHSLQALASGTLSIARAHAADVLEKTEAKLERELQRENEQIPSGKFARIKRKGEGLLHSKHVLLCVVILNVVDCVLVLGELILDIHYVVDLLHTSEVRGDNFLTSMQTKYPIHLDYVGDVDQLYVHILNAQIHWNDNTTESSLLQGTSSSHHAIQRRSVINITSDDAIGNHNVTNIYHVLGETDGNVYKQPENTIAINHTIHNHYRKEEDEESIEEKIAHGFHKASITILAILVLETIMKIIFIGKHMLENKVEVFDGFIVFVSFILDLVFIKGLTVYKIQSFVFILAFLVPWRVLRVVNSLIVAVMDHEHFRLKVLYKQKKEISSQLKDAKAHVKSLEHAKQVLEEMCVNAGISLWTIKQATAVGNESKHTRKSSNALSKGSGSIGSPSTPLINTETDNNNINLQFNFDVIAEHQDV